MIEDQAEQFRREAENCLARAEIAPDALTKRRMKKLADQWLKKAAKVAIRVQPPQGAPLK